MASSGNFWIAHGNQELDKQASADYYTPSFRLDGSQEYPAHNDCTVFFEDYAYSAEATTTEGHSSAFYPVAMPVEAISGYTEIPESYDIPPSVDNHDQSGLIFEASRAAYPGINIAAPAGIQALPLSYPLHDVVAPLAMHGNISSVPHCNPVSTNGNNAQASYALANIEQEGADPANLMPLPQIAYGTKKKRSATRKKRSDGLSGQSFAPKAVKRPPVRKHITSLSQQKHSRSIRVAAAPHVCLECGDTFTRKFNLTQHENAHAGLKNYSCDNCGRAFGRVQDQKRHVKNKSCPAFPRRHAAQRAIPAGIDVAGQADANACITPPAPSAVAFYPEAAPSDLISGYVNQYLSAECSWAFGDDRHNTKQLSLDQCDHHERTSFGTTASDLSPATAPEELAVRDGTSTWPQLLHDNMVQANSLCDWQIFENSCYS